MTRRFAKNEAIFWEGDQATNYYTVTTGTVRSCKLLDDGRRQIVAFHILDDMFGIESGEQHSLSAEATGDATVPLKRGYGETHRDERTSKT